MFVNDSFVAAGVDSLADRLRSIARGGSEIDVAQFQLVERNGVERTHGDRWAAEKGRVCDVAWAFLQNRIQISDVLIRRGNGFLLAFDGATAADAELAALGHRHALKEFFLGKRDEHPGAQVSVRCRSLAVKRLLEGLEDVDVSSAGAGVNATLPGAAIELIPPDVIVAAEAIAKLNAACRVAQWR